MATAAIVSRLKFKKGRPGGGTPSPQAFLIVFCLIMIIIDIFAGYTQDAFMALALLFFILILHYSGPQE